MIALKLIFIKKEFLSMKKIIVILIVLVISLPFIVAYFVKTPKEKTSDAPENHFVEGYSEKGYVKSGVDDSNGGEDEMVSKRLMLLEKMKEKGNNLPEKSVTNEIANNLNRDISINYFNPSEQSVLFNTYIDESSVGFDVNDAESVKGRLRSTGVTKVNNMRASQINIEELFIGIHQGKIKKIIIENAIGEKQEYYNLKLKNINNEYFEISGDYDQQGRMNLYFSSESENLVGKFTSTNLNHKFNYMIFNKKGKGYVYDIYKKN
jgi:hypothetical protein